MDVITRVTETIARMLGHGREGAAVRSFRLASTNSGPEHDAVISTNDLGDEAPAPPAEREEEADATIGTLFSKPEPVFPEADEANEPDQGDEEETEEGEIAVGHAGDFSLDIFDNDELSDEEKVDLPEGLEDIDTAKLVKDCEAVFERLKAGPQWSEPAE